MRATQTRDEVAGLEKKEHLFWWLPWASEGFIPGGSPTVAKPHLTNSKLRANILNN